MEQRKIPRRYLIIAPQKSTRAIHGKGGFFTGRVVVSGKGDLTKERQLAKDYDINHDGRISANERGGSLQGRSEARVRASRTARGHTREL